MRSSEFTHLTWQSYTLLHDLSQEQDGTIILHIYHVIRLVPITTRNIIFACITHSVAPRNTWPKKLTPLLVDAGHKETNSLLSQPLRLNKQSTMSPREAGPKKGSLSPEEFEQTARTTLSRNKKTPDPETPCEQSTASQYVHFIKTLYCEGTLQFDLECR